MSDTPYSTPAERLIARFGAKRLADWTGRHRSRVHAWSWPVSKGGTGGVVPVRLRAKIVAGALAELNQVLTGADFELQDGEVYLFEAAA